MSKGGATNSLRNADLTVKSKKYIKNKNLL